MREGSIEERNHLALLLEQLRTEMGIFIMALGTWLPREKYQNQEEKNLER